MTRFLSRPFHPLSLSVLSLAVCLLVAACGGGGGGAGGGTAEEVAQGQREFQRTCATCHGADAKGMPRLGKGLHENEFVRANSDAELVEFLKVGRPSTHPDNTRGVDMPPKGGNPALTEEQMLLIVKYMRSLQ